jgi:hypothetical protein
MRKSRRMDQLELELFKLKIELDLVHEILHGIIQSQEQKVQSLDSGKWYPRRLPPQQ